MFRLSFKGEPFFMLLESSVESGTFCSSEYADDDSVYYVKLFYLSLEWSLRMINDKFLTGYHKIIKCSYYYDTQCR